jgi:hypothetical protein
MEASVFTETHYQPPEDYWKPLTFLFLSHGGARKVEERGLFLHDSV